ncbi:NUDIX hydrolase [Streptomyces qinzhouensis]|uniref:NUDIX hydrolase n=1 Tax=Streptomyces qinzhouensis TaxID=2599401 RepID=A0A5B8IU67_9ACTN|nr:NUDIX hydrolase [Streptomyces qinzhouensis]QDY81269.1 NUDIX hydrolase [Streptomyces qinzhouensis]
MENVTPPARDDDRKTRVAAGVILQNGRLLLIKRATPEGSLTWQFPAGKIEPDESPEDAVIREVKQETGLVVTVTERLRERIHPGTGIRILYFACSILSGTAHRAAPDEVADITWVPLRDLSHYIPDGFFLPVQQYLDTTASHPERPAAPGGSAPGKGPVRGGHPGESR